MSARESSTAVRERTDRGKYCHCHAQRVRGDGAKFIEHNTPGGDFSRRLAHRRRSSKIFPNGTGPAKACANARGIVEDNIPEDQSIVINSKDGLIVVSGCGHAGIINTLTLCGIASFPKTPIYRHHRRLSTCLPRPTSRWTGRGQTQRIRRELF